MEIFMKNKKGLDFFSYLAEDENNNGSAGYWNTLHFLNTSTWWRLDMSKNYLRT